MRRNPIAAPRTVAALAAAAIGTAAFAMDWPSDNSPIRSSFGQNDGGKTSVGISFSTEGTVKSSDSGEIVFRSGIDQDAPLAFPAPLGNWVAVSHSDGIVGVYGRLSEFSQSAAPSIVEKGAVLGSAGASGWAAGVGYYYALFDRAERRWVNPFMLSNVREDSKQPSIKSVIFVSKDGQAFSLATVRALRQGTYRILVEAVDLDDRSPGAQLAPQRLSCMVNGIEQGALHLETIKAADGVLTVAGTEATPASRVYSAGGGYDIGEAKLTRGRATIEISAKDVMGNAKVVSYSIQVE